MSVYVLPEVSALGQPPPNSASTPEDSVLSVSTWAPPEVVVGLVGKVTDSGVDDRSVFARASASVSDVPSSITSASAIAVVIELSLIHI